MAAINVKVYVCAVGTVTLTYSLLKFMDMPLLILYVFICIQTSRLKFLIQRTQSCKMVITAIIYF